MPEIVRTFRTQCENAAALEAFSTCGNNFLLKFWLSPKKKVLALAKAFYSLLLCHSPKKENGHRSERSTNNLVFYWIHAVHKEMVPQTTAAYGFRREIKTLVFGTRKNAGLSTNSVHTFCIFLRL